ncbi:MAG: Gfo/Idh/MocA family oxidoreductase [Acidimicrobiales bacterium]
MAGAPVSLRAGVIGTSFGARIHVPALRQAGFDVVALVGVDPARTARRVERLGIPHACTSLAGALELGLDAVSIASPPATHAPLAAAAIDAGCHVLCEKPFTLNAAEAEDLVHRSAGAGVVALVGHEFRWSLAQSSIEWGLGHGMIGTPRMAVSASFISMLRSFPMPDWWSDPTQGGGWLNASGSHRIDALRQWFGEVEAVSAGLSAIRVHGSGVDDSFNIRCAMRDGTDVALVQSGAAAGPGASMTRVVGTTGSMWAEGDTVYVADDASPGGRVLHPPSELILPNVDALATGPLADMTRSELPPYIRLAQAFREAIEGRPYAPGPHPATFDDGLACMRVLDAVRQSAADGGRGTAIEEGEGGTS